MHEYAWVQRELFTLENTLLGYMADGLRWCGDPGSPGEGLGCLALQGVQGEGALGSARGIGVVGGATGTCPDATYTLSDHSGSRKIAFLRSTQRSRKKLICEVGPVCAP